MEADSKEASALTTLNMLGERLHHLEFLLHGSSNAFGIPDRIPVPRTHEDTISTRLNSLESGLHRLASRHAVVQDVLDLRMNSWLLNLC